MKGLRHICCLLLIAGLFSFCKSSVEDAKNKVVYNGPIAQTKDIYTLVSDSARLQIKLSAPLQLQYESGDGVYPKGLSMTFYDKKGQVINNVKANYGKYEKQKDEYFIRGNVIVENAIKKETMKTEELYWDKQKRKIHTDKFVTIKTPEQLIKGQGMTANQDFSSWKITKVTGIVSMQE